MMGGALPLAFVEETRIFPYEFVQRQSLKISKEFSGNEGVE